MHPAYINKVTDTMIQAAQTPGQGVTPGNSGANYAGFVPMNQGVGYIGGFNL